MSADRFERITERTPEMDDDIQPKLSLRWPWSFTVDIPLPGGGDAAAGFQAELRYHHEVERPHG